MQKKKLKITRENFVKIVLAVYVLIITVVLVVKWIGFAEQHKDQLRRTVQSDVALKIDYKKHLEAIRVLVAAETIDFFERAKERLTGENVKRVSDLSTAMRDILDTYFDENARRIAELSKEIKNTSSEDYEHRAGVVEEHGKSEFESDAPDEAVIRELNANLTALLKGLEGIINWYNAEQSFDTDIQYRLDQEQKEYIAPGVTQVDLAVITLPGGEEWSVLFNATRLSKNFLGGIEIWRGESLAYSAAVLQVKGIVLFVDQRGNAVQTASGNQVLLRIKELIGASLPEARAKDRLARAEKILGSSSVPSEPISSVRR